MLYRWRAWGSGRCSSWVGPFPDVSTTNRLGSHFTPNKIRLNLLSEAEKHGFFWNMTFFVGFKTFSIEVYLFSSCQFGQHNVYYPIRSTQCFHCFRMYWLYNLRGLVLNLARQMKHYQILWIYLMYPFSKEQILRVRKGEAHSTAP